MLQDKRKHHRFHNSFFRNYWDDDALINFFNNGTWNYFPSVNVIETTAEYKIEVALPGLDKNNFKIEIDGNTLELSAQKEVNVEDKDKEGHKYLRREFGYTTFHKVFTLPQNVDIDKIKASHNNGVLEIAIPKIKSEKVPSNRQISIQ